MSDDQLDNDLKDRIKQVFDNYEDDTAKEGWLLLREKYPEEEKDRGIFWLWRIAGVAAILLIALSIGLWLNYQPANKQNIARHTNKVERADSVGSTTPAVARNKNEQPGNTVNGASTQQQVNTVKPAFGSAAGVTTVYTPAHSSANKNSTAGSVAVNTGAVPVYSPAYSSANKNTAANTTRVDSNGKTAIAYQLPVTTKANSAIEKPATAAVAGTETGLTLIPTGPVTKPVENTQPKILAAAPADKGMQALFDNESKAAPVTKEKKLIDKKVMFGIYAATYVNYAKGSNKQFNTGGGVTSDIRLTENLSISTGISVGQNTLSYNSSVAYPQVALALATTTSHNFAASGNVLPALVPSSKDLNANMVNLDIPVDLKYTFTQRKGTTYIAAGLSSGTFINETYSTTYNYNVGNNASVQQAQDATHKTFDSFYLAQMFNVSFGVGYPVGKNQLIIEPFFKYPLNGLGDQHILFGSGGLNLKFNFDPPKSKH